MAKKYKREFVTPYWNAFSNWIGHHVRDISGIGPRMRMYRALSRSIVDTGERYAIPLSNGMQIPLLDAIDYLADIGDYDSIPRLKKLFGKYAQGLGETNKSYKWQDYAVTIIYGPDDYLPGIIQTHTAKALILLLHPTETKEFITETFTHAHAQSLSNTTIQTFVDFVYKNEIREKISSLFLKTGKLLKVRFQREYENFQKGRRKYLSYDDLYSSEMLLYGAYQLSDNQEKEEALQLLIDEYNHSTDSNSGNLDTTEKPRSAIRDIICEIVHRIPSGNEEDRQNIISKLDQKTFEEDMRRLEKNRHDC